MSNPIRAAIYASVSIDDEWQCITCDDQIEQAMNFVNEHKDNITIQTVLTDTGYSDANELLRPGFVKLLCMILLNDIDLIIVDNACRLCTSVKHMFDLNDTFNRHKVSVLTTDDGKRHDLASIFYETIDRELYQMELEDFAH